jgi:hypothetical protein
MSDYNTDERDTKDLGQCGYLIVMRGFR